MPCVGRTVTKKHTSCFRRLSHSCLISLRTLSATVTSARTLDGALSPMLGLATSTTANDWMGWAMRAHPPKYTLPSSALLVENLQLLVTDATTLVRLDFQFELNYIIHHLVFCLFSFVLSADQVFYRFWDMSLKSIFQVCGVLCHGNDIQLWRGNKLIWLMIQ